MIRDLAAECFHASLRAEFLDRELFFDLEEVKVMANVCREFYNHRRPHGALGYLPPVRPSRKLRYGFPLRPSPPLRFLLDRTTLYP